MADAADSLPFDDRDGSIWMDGKVMPWREASLHPLTHGLHYGSCVFEGERVYGGEIFELEAHTARLFHSAEVLGFEIPFSVEEINDACREVVSLNSIVDGYVRPVAWRGSEMMGVSAQHSSIHVAIAVWEWPSYFSPEAKLKGLRLKITKWRRPSPETAPIDAKAAGLYMICTIAKHEAEREGFDDALMYDYRGLIAESTGSNIFFVKDGVIHTPTPDCFLDGITRQTVIRLAQARGIEVIERAIKPEEMSDFEECFLTGTAVEVTPVGEIGDYRFKAGEITKNLMADFDKLTGSDA